MRPRPGYGIRRLPTDTRAVSIIEMALVMPLFLVLLYGMLGYGQYFLLAHNVQQLANDAARATVAGLDATERQSLANASVTAELASLRELRAARLTTTIEEAPNVVTVRLRYDASDVPLLRTSLVPMPSTLIDRRAVVRPGGAS